MKLQLKNGLSSLLAAGFAWAMLAGAAQAADFTMKVSHVASTAQPVYTCVEVMKSYIERLSRGRVEVQHYPAAQLGHFRQSVEQVQVGSLELTFTTGGGISNLFGPIQAFDIPYLFRSDRVVDKIMDDPIINGTLRKDLLEATKTVRLMGITGDHGWRSFITNRDVKVASDLEGLKVRTIESPISMELARALGANPTPIPWQELYTSLGTGIVNGTKNSVSDVLDMSFTDYIKFAVLDKHTFTFFFWYTNDNWIKSLPADMQKVVLDGFRAMKVTCDGYIDAAMLPKWKKWEELGGKIHIPSAEEKKTFLPGQKAVADWFVSQYGDSYYKMIQAAVQRAEAAIDAEDKAVLGN